MRNRAPTWTSSRSSASQKRLRGHTERQYPLQEKFVWVGLGTGAVVGTLFLSLVAGFSVAVLFTTVGLLWRREATPILPFCIAYQWVFISTGYFYMQAYGHFPNLDPIGDVSLSVTYSLLGLLSLSLGLRFGISVFDKFNPKYKKLSFFGGYNLKSLFWFVIVLNLFRWVFQYSPARIWFAGGQILSSLFLIASVVLVMLAIAVAWKGEGYRYLAAALLFVSVPELASRMSSFKTPLFLTFIGLLTVWEPWKEISPRVPSRRRALKWVIGIAGGILLFGVFWMGGMKAAWRAQVDSGEVSEDVVERLGGFGALAVDVTENLTIQEAAENMAGRFSSSTGYFADAIRRVPDQVPHEGGALTMRAVQHVTMPRVLFPEKPSLGMDSWLVREYAGRNVAGARLGTSIGFTYIGQFYVDYGFPMMLFPLFLYGVLIGMLYRMPVISCPSKEIYFSVVTVIFVASFLTFGSDLAKQAGSIIMKTAAITAVLYLLGDRIHKISKT